MAKGFDNLLMTLVDLNKGKIPSDNTPPNQTNSELPKSGYSAPGYANVGLPGGTDFDRFYYPGHIMGPSSMIVDQAPTFSIPEPLNAGATASTGFDNSRAVPINSVSYGLPGYADTNNNKHYYPEFDNSIANAEKMILNGSLGNGRKARRDAWLALGGSPEAYEQAQANINKRFASKAVRRNTNISSRKPSQQEVTARRAQQDELLRQSMLRSAQQNPNSSVRANMPSHFNSSTTMQQYYLNNPDLWR